MNVMPSATRYITNEIPSNNRNWPPLFQQITSATRPSNWFSGEKMRKKLPGLTTRKYSRATPMDSGIFEPQDRASTMDVYMFTSKRPLATAIDANTISGFIIFFCKERVARSCRIVFNGHLYRDVP